MQEALECRWQLTLQNHLNYCMRISIDFQIQFPANTSHAERENANTVLHLSCVEQLWENNKTLGKLHLKTCKQINWPVIGQISWYNNYVTLIELLCKPPPPSITVLKLIHKNFKNKRETPNPGHHRQPSDQPMQI